MDLVRKYYDIIVETLKKIETNEKENIRKGAELMAEAIMEDKLIHVFGSGGHSNMATEEMFHRAGGLACINPIFVDGIRIPHIPRAERLLGYAEEIFRFYDLKKGDLLIIVNAYGINSVTIESALLAKEKGIKTIGVTGTEYAKNLPKDFVGRHPSGKALHELVDIFINTYIPYGDAVIETEGCRAKVAPITTFANSFILNSLVIETARILASKGIEPPIICSINTLNGEERNRWLYDKYRKRIRWL